MLYKRLLTRLKRLEQKPEPLDVIIDCPCGACEKVPRSPTMLPRVTHIGSDGREIRTYDLCPLVKWK